MNQTTFHLLAVSPVGLCQPPHACSVVSGAGVGGARPGQLFAKVRRLYANLGISERTEIEFFNGPHSINGKATYDFLHRHLKWPKR